MSEREVWTEERRRENRDLGERVAVIESQYEVIEKMQTQLDDMTAVLSQIEGAIKFIKVIAWLAGIGMTAWGLILAQIGVQTGVHK